MKVMYSIDGIKHILKTDVSLYRFYLSGSEEILKYSILDLLKYKTNSKLKSLKNQASLIIPQNTIYYTTNINQVKALRKDVSVVVISETKPSTKLLKDNSLTEISCSSLFFSQIIDLINIYSNLLELNIEKSHAKQIATCFEDNIEGLINFLYIIYFSEGKVSHSYEYTLDYQLPVFRFIDSVFNKDFGKLIKYLQLFDKKEIIKVLIILLLRCEKLLKIKKGNNDKVSNSLKSQASKMSLEELSFLLKGVHFIIEDIKNTTFDHKELFTFKLLKLLLGDSA